ncbi:MAG: rubrerythrin family protein [Thermoanaerobaculia bacterium]
MKKIAITIAVAALFVILMPGAGSTAQAATPKSLDNLQAAFNGESNAHARYLEFAKKADAEGYGPVASLFLAAARAEEIHAANHAVVIKSLGGVPKATIEKVVVNSTKENLEASIKGESYERDTMYPEFIATAKKEGQRDALKSFNYAKTAEAEHAKLYSESVKNLATLKGAKVTYYVCTVCGYTTKDLNFAKCLSCFNPKDKYVAVS